MKSHELESITEKISFLNMCSIFSDARRIYKETYDILISEGVNDDKAKKVACKVSDGYIRSKSA